LLLLQAWGDAGYFMKKISNIEEGFYRWSQYGREKPASKETLVKYRDCLSWFKRDVGDLGVKKIRKEDFIKLREKMQARGTGSARIRSVVFTMKAFLRYCREELGLKVLNPDLVKAPKREKREVRFLAEDKVAKLVNSIKIKNDWAPKTHIRKPRPNLHGLRLRAFIETLLGTGMRISEALSLDKNDIDFEQRETKIIGKGDKERTVYFTKRAIGWIKKYLRARDDSNEALFISHCEAKRWTRDSAQTVIARFSEKVGIEFSAHTIRHTAGTQLLFNGTDIKTIQIFLGHESIQTTARFYLGIDKRKIKEAVDKNLKYT